MITLSGASGKGALWCTFIIPQYFPDGATFTNTRTLDEMAIPGEWYLPPPDSTWYDVSKSVYGPRLTHLQLGMLASVDKDSADFNPCQHSTMRGDACYVGPHGEFGPHWKNRYVATPYFSSVDGDFMPRPTGRYHSVSFGRTCTATSPYGYDRNGVIVKLKLNSSYPELYYRSYYLSSNFAPSWVRLALLERGDDYQSGKWYAKHVNSSAATPRLVEDGFLRSYLMKTDWSRPSRTELTRDTFIEYHTDDSYTPKERLGLVGIPYTKETSRRVTKCKILAVKSTSPGIFYTKVRMEYVVSWYGWRPWEDYSGTETFTIERVCALQVLSPGLTAGPAEPSTLEAGRYCHQAIERAKLLYDHEAATRSRTNAVNDVQELDSNWIENLSQVKGTMDVIKPLMQGYSAAQSGDVVQARKALASAYLSYKYAVAPAIRDFHNIKDDGHKTLQLITKNRFANERRLGLNIQKGIPVLDTTATLSYFTTLHLLLKDSVFSELWNGLDRLNLDPSAANLWDLIPFSFVADWFVRMGPTLSTISNYNNSIVHRDLVASIETFKVQWPIGEEEIKTLFSNTIRSMGKPIEYGWYDRRIYHEMGKIDPISILKGNGLSRSQMTQAAALLTVMEAFD